MDSQKDTPTRPTVLDVDLSGDIPNELKTRPQWVLWRYELRRNKKTGDLKWAKEPKQTNGINAKSDDAETWTTFDDVVGVYRDGKFDGIAYVFAADDPYCGIDLDACRDPDSGQLTPWADDIVNRVGSYCDVSPSGYGVKLVALARVPVPMATDGKKPRTGYVTKLKDVETYGDKDPEIAAFNERRYWCLTGRCHGLHTDIVDGQKSINAMHADLWGENRATKKTNGHAKRTTSKLGDVESYINACRTAEDRSVADYALCCKAIEEGWDRESLWAQVASVGKFGERGREYFDTTWDNAEHQTERKPHRRTTAKTDNVISDGLVTNGEPTTIDVDGKSKTIIVPHKMREIIASINGQTEDWPRRVDNVLFVHDEHGVSWLEKPHQLFGWLHSRTGHVKWYGNAGAVKQSEVFAELARTTTRYTSVENLPHEPMIDGHYYTCGGVNPGDGSALDHLVRRFSPATPIDHDLIKTAFITPAWGGPCGTRPCYVITSDDGRGAGKSTLAKMVGLVWGGVIDFSHNEEIGKIKTRLLSPPALVKRVALLDNVKSSRFSWGELEGMITALEVGGHRMYVGEATRPNTLTWFITLNGAALSTDMAQRAVIVKIRKPQRRATWEEETTQFIAENQQRIIADAVAALRGEVFPLKAFSRWASWEREILQRTPEPAEAQAVILERQNVVDVESDEVEILEDHFACELNSMNYDADSDVVFLPSKIAANWYNQALGENTKVVAAMRAINQRIDEKKVKHLQRNGCNAWGRGVIWHGANSAIDAVTKTDIESRQNLYSKKW